jgi:hypothetical protein
MAHATRAEEFNAGVKISTRAGVVGFARELRQGHSGGTSRSKWRGANGVREPAQSERGKAWNWRTACIRVSAGSKRDANRDEEWAGPTSYLTTEDIMKATKKAKSAKKAVVHKGKSLEAVKPLTKIAAGANTSTTPTESVSLNYGGIQWSYKQQ